MSARGRRRSVEPGYVTSRSQAAQKFRDVAHLVVDEPGSAQAAAALYVLAGIAAADTICGKVLGEIYRGQDHRQATTVLREVKGSGKSVNALSKLLDIKDAAHYSSTVTADELTRARRAAETLLAEMDSHLGR